MNRGFSNQPVNWNIDYSQNRVGEIYGNAASNMGGILGNALQDYAKTSRAKAEKEAKEQAAVKYLMGNRKMSEEDAKAAAKGVGVENVINFAQLDQQKNESDARIAQFTKKAQDDDAEKATLRQENQIFKAVMSGAGAPGRPPPMLARNGTPDADMSARGMTTRMAQSGMGMENALKAGAMVDNMTPRHKDGPSVMTLDDGTRILTGSGQIIPKDKPAKEVERRQFTRNGQTITAIKNGNQWLEESSGQPIDVMTEDPSNFTRNLQPNPAVWAPVAPAAPTTTGKRKYTIIQEKQ